MGHSTGATSPSTSKRYRTKGRSGAPRGPKESGPHTPYHGARAVGRRAGVLLDSGVRRGSDVVKALALGADAVMVGRAPLYGMAAAGEAGVTRALALLHEEIARVMALLGVTDTGQIDESVLAGQV